MTYSQKTYKLYAYLIVIGDTKTPIIRKIMKLGCSKGITLPKSWLEFLERQYGSAIEEVAVEVDRVLIISPILPKKELVVVEHE
jgi:antitoxin component of MazEF toxin-antitoxin module